MDDIVKVGLFLKKKFPKRSKLIFLKICLPIEKGGKKEMAELLSLTVTIYLECMYSKTSVHNI